VAGLRAAAKNQWWEAPFWLFLPCLLPLSPDWKVGPYAAPAYLALAVTFLAWVASRFKTLAPVAAIAVGFVLMIPSFLSKRMWNHLERPVAQLSAWAARETPRDAVFLFRDYGRRNPNVPGMFRARALRAVWVDWKGGGQVNYYEGWSREWWRRWKIAEEPPQGDETELWRREKVDYLIFAHPLPEAGPVVFETGPFRVVKVRR
jgi:hypothetical protein